MLKRFFKSLQQPRAEGDRLRVCREIDSSGVRFQVNTDNGLAPLEDWYRHGRIVSPDEFSTTVLTLRQMSAEGTAEVREDQVFVDTESLYSIDEVDRLSLSVAPPFPFIPVLSCSSDMAHDDFRYELKYEKIDRSPAPILSRCGCCFESGGERWLIPQSL